MINLHYKIIYLKDTIYKFLENLENTKEIWSWGESVPLGTYIIGIYLITYYKVTGFIIQF